MDKYEEYSNSWREAIDKERRFWQYYLNIIYIFQFGLLIIMIFFFIENDDKTCYELDKIKIKFTIIIIMKSLKQ